MVSNPRIEGLSDWRPLARGGFAIVWEARQESLNRLVAVKVDSRKLDTPEERERFLREAGAAGRLSGHPGIVTVHDAGLLPDDRPYLVMELCTGGSLTRRLDPEARPSQEWVRDVGIRIADALAAAHAQGVLHRDVKPANVLIDEYGHAGLADFGLAVLPDPDAEPEELDALTPAYAPPEAFAAHAPTEGGDVYSLAATLYALLGGRPPRALDDGRPEVESVIARLADPVEPLPDVDPALMDTLLAALVDDPAARPSAAGFRDALAALPLGAPAQLPGPTVLEGPRTEFPAKPSDPAAAGGRSRRRVLAMAAALVVLVALVGVGIALTGDPRGAAAPVPAPSTEVTTGSATSPSPTPTPPAGFVDCSARFGAGVMCGPTPPQCWGGVTSAFDSPYVASAAGCESNHVYQTFAAGPLTFAVRRQSQLDKDPTVRKVCTAAVVNAMLDPADRRGDWEVIAIPPQTEQANDDMYRCIFGRGERGRPLTLHP